MSLLLGVVGADHVDADHRYQRGDREADQKYCVVRFLIVHRGRSMLFVQLADGFGVEHREP